MSIRYRKEYKTWQVYWNNPITKKRESLSFKSEHEARKEDSLIRHRLQFEPESFRRDEEPEPVVVSTISDVFFDYLKEKQFPKKDLETVLYRMQLCLKTLGEKPLAEVTNLDLQALVSSYKGEYIPATAYSALTTVCAVFYYAMRKELLTEMRFPEIPSPQYKQFVPPRLKNYTRLQKDFSRICGSSSLTRRNEKNLIGCEYSSYLRGSCTPYQACHCDRCVYRRENRRM